MAKSVFIRNQYGSLIRRTDHMVPLGATHYHECDGNYGYYRYIDSDVKGSILLYFSPSAGAWVPSDCDGGLLKPIEAIE